MKLSIAGLRGAAAALLLVTSVVASPQALEKARRSQPPRFETFKGVIVAAAKGPTVPDDAGELVLTVRDGDMVRTFVVRLAPSETPTTVTRTGEPVPHEGVRAALAVADRPATVEYDAAVPAGDRGPLARSVELGEVRPTSSTVRGLDIEEVSVGTGAIAERGRRVRVHYRGWIKDGRKFDDSYEAGQPIAFKLGAGAVIRGWDLGIEGMRVGGKRRLTIVHYLAYGARGAGGVIPPYATLVFDVELVAVE